MTPLSGILFFFFFFNFNGTSVSVNVKKINKELYKLNLLFLHCFVETVMLENIYFFKSKDSFYLVNNEKKNRDRPELDCTIKSTSAI